MPTTSPAPSGSRFFQSSDGVRLHVLEAAPAAQGPAAREPIIVLVPGWAMPASIWRDQLATLGRRHRVAAFDPRGQGESEAPSGGYDIDRRAEDLHDLLSQYRQVVLVGWSLGALEALRYVCRHGEAKLAALVLVDSSVGEGPPTPPSRFAEELRRDRRGAVSAFVQAIFGKPRPAADIDTLTEAALRMPLEASITLFPGHVPRADWRNTARAFAGPLLYVVTAQFADQARTLRKHRPATRIEVFRNAGHALFADEPERFNALLLDFVGGLR